MRSLLNCIFSAGLLLTCYAEPSWIGLDREKNQAQVMPQGQWIWQNEDHLKVVNKTVTFQKNFELKEEYTSANLLIAADDKFVLNVNGQKVFEHNKWSDLVPIDIMKYLAPGNNIIQIDVTNGSLSPSGLILDLIIKRKNKEDLIIYTDNTWVVKEDGHPWAPVKSIGKYGVAPWGRELEYLDNKLDLPPASYLRKEFETSKEVKKASFTGTALGLFTVEINGKQVHDEYFNPGWTDYHKRVYTRTYDVTELIRDRKKSAIGIVLVDGWYAGFVGYHGKRDLYGKNPRFYGYLDIEYYDGTKHRVESDLSWKAAKGPTFEADFQKGEAYDARLEMPGWNQVNFDDSLWQKVDVTESINAKLLPHPSAPVRAFREMKPTKVTNPKKGIYVFHMESNFAGFARLKVKAPRGTKIVLNFGEMLKEDGTILTENLRGARSQDTYICKGDGIEIWQPSFTYHGFQYVSVTGYPGEPPIDAITGVEVTTDLQLTGTFETSNEQINQLYQNIIQTQRANFIDIPTDCPQRDERLGWTGDAQAYVRTACYNNDVKLFFSKWLQDLRDAQLDSGCFPSVAPSISGSGGNECGGPGWADAGIICPWTIYEVYNDKQVLTDSYASMTKFMDYRIKSMKNFLPPENFHAYGDWLNINADTPKDLIYITYTAGNAQIMTKVAELLEKVQDVIKYKNFYENLKKSFNEHYVEEDGKIKGHTQTAYVLALKYDLVDGERYQQAVAHLVERIEARNVHLSTGFVGTKDLMNVLSKIGRNDLACRLLFNDTYPSWLLPVKNGATSIWERWNGWTPEHGFNSMEMNSFSHYSYGSVGQWMFENIGGIQMGSPGYEHVIIKPIITEYLSWAKVSYQSVNGMISVEWRKNDKQLLLAVKVPTNATIYIPGELEPRRLPAGEYSFRSKIK
ncbi:MAG: glycoside hydrolase family 78 protein [Lentisphaeria bacterium]|nr:glycoside hydrolase family 78 protein [Lentisphaeria bacterium]